MLTFPIAISVWNYNSLNDSYEINHFKQTNKLNSVTSYRKFKSRTNYPSQPFEANKKQQLVSSSLFLHCSQVQKKQYRTPKSDEATLEHPTCVATGDFQTI